MVLASQAFTALIPLLMVVSAVLPAGSGTAVSDSVIRRFGLSGDAARSVEIVFAHTDDVSVGVGSLLLLVFSGVSLTRRLQRMYLQAWGLDPIPGMRGSVNAAMGLAALLVELVLLYLIRTLVRTLPFDWALEIPLSAVASLVLWTSIPYLLLDRRLAWQRLLPSGALAGTAASIYGVATAIYMPPLMESYSDRYGLFGVTIAIVGWLLCVCLIVVAAVIIAAEFDRAPESWARRLRMRLGFGPDGAQDTSRADRPGPLDL
ncbi:MAG: YhjD/YihY/BrkB family envelope integrity protein [Nocardioides sp.]